VAPVKLDPLRVITVPATPHTLERDVSTGAFKTVIAVFFVALHRFTSVAVTV
jgi:hypothetical protein